MRISKKEIEIVLPLGNKLLATNIVRSITKRQSTRNLAKKKCNDGASKSYNIVRHTEIRKWHHNYTTSVKPLILAVHYPSNQWCRDKEVGFPRHVVYQGFLAKQVNEIVWCSENAPRFQVQQDQYRIPCWGQADIH